MVIRFFCKAHLPVFGLAEPSPPPSFADSPFFPIPFPLVKRREGLKWMVLTSFFLFWFLIRLFLLLLTSEKGANA